MIRWHAFPLALALAAAPAAAAEFSIEQAEARSKATGRPILAVAGTKT